MFSDADCLMTPQLLEYTLFDNAELGERLDESVNFASNKNGQIRASSPIAIKEVMFPAFYPFKVRTIKKINDTYEVFITSPDSFNYTDEHFQMLNTTIFENNYDISEIRNMFKLSDLKTLDDFLPLRQSDPDFFYEVYYYNLYHRNLLALANNEISSEVR